MSSELLKVLHPRAYEPRAKRDIRSVFWRITRDQAKESEVREVVGEIVFNAFLGGKLQAARELRERFSMVHGDEYRILEDKRGKYVEDFRRVLSDYRSGKEKLQAYYRRLNILAQVAVWELYNRGKLNRIRELSLKQRGFAQERVEWVAWFATLDERTCPECGELHGQYWSIWDTFPMPPLHPGCRCTIIAKVYVSREEAMIQVKEAG